MNERGSTAVNVILAVLLILLAGLGAWQWQQIKIDDLKGELGVLQKRVEAEDSGEAEAEEAGFRYMSNKEVTVEVYEPERSQKVDSPLKVFGRVPGNWSQEAVFAVELVDEGGEVLGKANARIIGDWMTEELVPFSAEIEFKDTPDVRGDLVLIKANPSGLDENTDKVVIPLVL